MVNAYRASVLVLALLSSLRPEEPLPTLSGQMTTGGPSITGRQEAPGALTVGPGTSAATTGGGPRVVARYIPGCVSATGSVGVDTCAATPCPEGEIRSTRASVVVPAGGVTPPLSEWAFEPPGCYPPAADEVVTPVIDGTVMVDVFQGLVAPAVAFIQPASGKALVQMPLIVYAQSAAQAWTPDVLGQTVAVRATPTSYTWDFGDGNDPVTTTDPGAPYPDETVSHVYTTTGDVNVTLITSYTGEFSVDGGATWQPIPGTATATTPSVPVHLVEARAHLIE